MSGDLRAAKYLSERKERSPTSEAPKLEDPYDLSRLTDDELGDLERLLSWRRTQRIAVVKAVANEIACVVLPLSLPVEHL